MLLDFEMVETTIIQALQWLRLMIETTGAVIVGVGVMQVIFQLMMTVIKHQQTSYNAIRLTLSRYLALALEFQLGADILSTAIAPTWEQIGKLGAIAIIRTALNYFLSREMEAERKAQEKEEDFRPGKAG